MAPVLAGGPRTSAMGGLLILASEYVIFYIAPNSPLAESMRQHRV